MKRIMIAAIAVFYAGMANATTLTFNQINNVPVVESGYTYTNYSSYNPGGMIYLHDDSGQRSVTISRVDGGSFGANSALISGYSHVYTTGSQAQFDEIKDGAYWSDPWAKSAKPVYDNFTVEGIRDGQVVAYTTGYASGSSPQYNFNPSFSNITELRISLKLPDFPLASRWNVPRTPYTNYCAYWCAGFMMRSLDLTENPSPVPLPASGLLLCAGLLGFGALRRRNRHPA